MEIREQKMRCLSFSSLPFPSLFSFASLLFSSLHLHSYFPRVARMQSQHSVKQQPTAMMLRHLTLYGGTGTNRHLHVYARSVRDLDDAAGCRCAVPLPARTGSHVQTTSASRQTHWRSQRQKSMQRPTMEADHSHTALKRTSNYLGA
jgi:hypothetical protein